MKILLSLPPNLVDSFHEITGLSHDDFFCASDPVGHRVGSGGGSTYLLENYSRDAINRVSDKKILIHAGGESRRLPSYSTSGKILTPIPVDGKSLMTMQLPLYKSIMRKAPKDVNTLIASGDVFIKTSNKLQEIPVADVICYGLEAEPELAKNHGVFAMRRDNPMELDFMMQKPSVERLAEVKQTHNYLMDIGIWLFSDKAMQMLAKRSRDNEGNIKYYDLYSDFGRCLGNHPELDDNEVNELTVKVLTLDGGEFYHYGTSLELISSTEAVSGQKKTIFTQNSVVKISFSPENHEIWIENSFVGKNWTLSEKNIITGVPKNDWKICLRPNDCLDIVPIGGTSWVARPYGFDEPFKYVNAGTGTDLFKTPAFPVVSDVETLGEVVNRILDGENISGYPMVSAEDILNKANLRRLFKQRTSWNLKS